MNMFLASFVAFFLWFAPAHAQLQKVTTCGSATPPAGVTGGYMDPNGSQCVNTATTTAPVSQAGATVTTGGTFQQALAANTARTNCLVQNTSAHVAYVYWLGSGTATVTNGFQVLAGQWFQCATPAGVIKTAILWTTGTTGDPFVITENQ